MNLILPKIACLCPTYKRPRLLESALACFTHQDYDPARRRLFIWDDANQFDSHDGSDWEVISTEERFSDLPAKYNALSKRAMDWGADVLAIWEDDDVFLKWHLAQIGDACGNRGVHFFRLPQVYSNYALPKGVVQLEGADGRFHSSWAFTVQAFHAIGGWPKTPRLDFDQQIGSKLRAFDPQPAFNPFYKPSYVYRWGNGLFHGSQAGEEGFAELWKRVGDLPAPKQGIAKPVFDEETLRIWETVGR